MNKNSKKQRSGWLSLATLVAITMSLLLIIPPNMSSVLAQTCGGGGGGCGTVGGAGFNPVDGGAGSDGCSPILIDTVGQGFHLTSAEGGVMFDISGTGHPVQIAWTDARYRNAFLALPGPDGLVHNGKELFGNFTPQAQSPHLNGFLALAEFDKAESGGNGDGVIDKKDAVFSRLRLWNDENHDGICQLSELHTLPELGVSSISLNYRESRRIDRYGNEFRYRGLINVSAQNQGSGSPADPITYDVFLVGAIHN